MSNKRPEYFNKEIIINGYTFYKNEQDRFYVPRTKEEFEKFLDAIYAMTDISTEEQKTNYKIIKKYPFLLPKNRWDYGIDMSEYGFDFSWTEIDNMPKGWFSAFGPQMLNEIKKLFLEKNPDFLYQYQIVDIKEKWGELRWYDNGGPKGIYEIIDSYSTISSKTCILCGKPGKVDTSKHWIMPLCDKHLLEKFSEEIISEYEEAYKILATPEQE